jgi:protein involved in polysaccharide export with SLBB domain
MKYLFAIVLLCAAIQPIAAKDILPQPPAILLPGALLRIRLSGVPAADASEINSQLFDVAADGSVTLPHIGPIMVIGLTFSQAEQVIERAYLNQNIYRWPTITIEDPSTAQPRRPKELDAPGPGYRKHVKLPHTA